MICCVCNSCQKRKAEGGRKHREERENKRMMVCTSSKAGIEQHTVDFRFPCTLAFASPSSSEPDPYDARPVYAINTLPKLPKDVVG